MKQAVSILVVCLALVSTTYAGNVSKAKDFIKAGMYPQAIELLDKEIHENPTNVEAHFELGSCYVTQGRYEDADARFASAVRLQADYGYKIGGIYKAAGLTAADKGQIDTASTLLNKAITYQPDLKSGLASAMFDKGKATNKGAYFDLAYQLDSTIGVKIGAHFSALSQSKGNETEKIDALANAAKYDPKYGEVYQASKNKLGRGYLEKAMELATNPGREAETTKHRNLAKKYLGEAVVEKEFPEVVIYAIRPEPYMFKLKAGKQNDHWIELSGNNQQYNFMGEEGCDFNILFSDGYVAKSDEHIGPNHGRKIKFRALTDCTQVDGGAGFRYK